MAHGWCKGRNEQGGGAPKPAVLLAMCGVRRAGWAASPPAGALPERRVTWGRELPGQEAGSDSPAAASHRKLQAQQRAFTCYYLFLRNNAVW